MHFWRILEIDRLLQDGRHLSAAEIASRIEDGSYSPRTIQRDIEFMRNTLNAPVESDGSGYWYGEPNFFIKSIPLTEGEAFAVAVLNPLLEQYRSTPLEGQLRSVFQKITSCLPEKVTVDTSFLNPKITFIPDKCESADPGMFQVVFDALRECRPLCFGYRPLSKSSYMERTIDPYHVVCQRGNWYVLGRDHGKGDVRIFSFGRMRDPHLGEGGFRMPEDFDPADWFDAEMGVWLNKGEPMTVELLFDKEVGTFALNRSWHTGQEVRQNEDGSVYVKFTTTQKQEVLRQVLGQGHTVKVLAPPELVAEVKAELEKMQGLYGE
ncbi:MAG: transcriptional regulator [Treponema sp.]|nr:transcriptional regulator [Treponema sp.]